jgi:hypothetical protein
MGRRRAGTFKAGLRKLNVVVTRLGSGNDSRSGALMKGRAGLEGLRSR